ncbi:hypothetical protein HMPREF3227_02501 [Corynebacterium sp. CMW7794]|nr:hypothetical protein HMPREF3227_02501 [Corynebacterium sp. CMW7794]
MCRQEAKKTVECPRRVLLSPLMRIFFVVEDGSNDLSLGSLPEFLVHS